MKVFHVKIDYNVQFGDKMRLLTSEYLETFHIQAESTSDALIKVALKIEGKKANDITISETNKEVMTARVEKLEEDIALLKQRLGEERHENIQDQD